MHISIFQILSLYPSNERKMLITSLNSIFWVSREYFFPADHIKLRLIPDVVDVQIKDSDKISVHVYQPLKSEERTGDILPADSHSCQHGSMLSPRLVLIKNLSPMKYFNFHNPYCLYFHPSVICHIHIQSSPLSPQQLVLNIL